MSIHPRMLAVLASCLSATAICATAAGSPSDDAISIRSDFPGGNVLVEKIEGDDVHIEPDLRGGRDWFYWCFEIRTAAARRLRFIFPEKQMAFVAAQGPAISRDEGKTWSWLGNEEATGSSFVCSFEPARKVRLAVTIPYLQGDLDRFLNEEEGNEHLATSVLTKTRKGRPVELLRIGAPGDGRIAVLMTARHHACESMASFLLEGFLRAALSNTDAGKAFRKRYVLYAVPIVDKDGVEEGDQGKNRSPHDHNRDYIDAPLFPEVAAIMRLGREKPIRIVMDYHCPTLWMDYHQVIYFPGSRDIPETNLSNVTRLAGRIKNLLPEKAPRGCLVMLKSERGPGHFSDHFAHKEGAIMAVTLEFPYAPNGKAMDPASCVRYGETILQAWNETEFDGL